jgi:AbrB family looped-hinge helix DNA binding protein
MVMETTRLSSKGQVIIPKIFRELLNWNIGQELMVIKTEDGLMLKPIKPFIESSLTEVAGCLRYRGQPKKLAEWDAAIAKGLTEQWHDCD